MGIRRALNESRAAQGLNKISDGSTGKGSAPRQSMKPSWIDLEEVSRDKSAVWFKTRFGKKRVSLADVLEYEKLFIKNEKKG